MLRRGACGAPGLLWRGFGSLALVAVLAFSAPAFGDDVTVVVPSGSEASGGSTVDASATGDNAGAVVNSTTHTSATMGSRRHGSTRDGWVSAHAGTGGVAVGYQGGPSGGSQARAATTGTARSFSKRGVVHAEAMATANAGAVAVAGGSLAKSGSGSTAVAAAAGGNSPTAYAAAGSDVYALAVGGKTQQAIASAGPNDVIQTLNNARMSITIAYADSGFYSIAMSSNHSATAFASTYGNGGAFTLEDVFAAAKTAASAYATATRTTASAWAASTARSISGTSTGVSAAASSSFAQARVEIRFVQVHDGSSASGTAQVRACVQRDWRSWKKLDPEAKKKWHTVVCHVRVE